MDFATFKIKYAETMMYYQRIENDIKCIYAYMRAGDVDQVIEQFRAILKFIFSVDNENGIVPNNDEPIGMIKWINEVERPRRVELFKQSKARDIISYNAKNPSNKMKRIIFIIDEYADLVRTADNLGTRKEFENNLSQAAAMVRSLGIHIILATQWASSSIVTSAIKANFPFRISFKLPQHQDSSTILDRTGAEDLLGKGDMLVLDNGVLTRVQSCYIDADSELGDFLKKYE